MLIYGFTEAYNNTAASYMKVGDESMRVISFRKIEKGNLPHLYYILHKMKPLGKDFNTFTFYVTWASLFIELQRGK